MISLKKIIAKKTIMASLLVLFTVVIASACSFNDGKRYKGKMFNKFDTNSDGFITKNEARKISTDIFNNADLDKDGKLTKEESSNYYSENVKKNKMFKRKKHNKKFNKFDTNSDGFITKNEIETFITNIFTNADLDKDGKLTKEEVRKHYKSKRKSCEK